MDKWTAIEGAPYPLGVSFIQAEKAYNFALYSKHATGLILNLYSEDDSATPVFIHRFNYLRNKSGRVWHCRIPAEVVDQALYYAYQVEGPFDLAEGHRFDASKVLLDPYARAICFPRAFSREAAIGPGSNAGKAPLGVIRCPEKPFDWTGDHKPMHTSDTIIYELHVRGFTRRANSGVDPDKRGTFAALALKIPYLKELGVTVVELMPVFQFDPQEGNFWGYMPMSFFALHQAYSGRKDFSEQLDEFKAMVKAFHQADIEVVLDVVFNHTGEGKEDGPTYGFRGIDNTTYYLLEADRSRYRNDAGTGNVLHTANRYVRTMILDSLRYWVKETHVDGFRFDLATIFTRNSDGSINLADPPIVSAIRTDPDLAKVLLIAEAWDVSSYQLGRNFPGSMWFQWNGQYRDDARSFVRGDSGQVGRLMQRLYGSDDLFPDSLIEAYRPFQSVNYITSHDGFCLYDLAAYDKKRNWANGHQNMDGTDNDLSWNCGWEGDEGLLPAVAALRRRQVKNFFCLLMLSNGTPMFCAGDEFMNTQLGNNNPYNQDNETTWLNWDLLERNKDVFRFFKLMIAFRKAHPSLGRSRFWRDDIRWFGVGPEVDWSSQSRSMAFFLNGESQKDQGIYVMINSSSEELEFAIQKGTNWRRVVDTALDGPHDIAEAGQEEPLTSLTYRVKPRSVVVLLGKPA
ncbi:MAG: glycogen-debranching protein [Desulfomonile tiedjei]|nr:glycogen-debranching protein [Desulfomonile tiedjei]